MAVIPFYSVECSHQSIASKQNSRPVGLLFLPGFSNMFKVVAVFFIFILLYSPSHCAEHVHDVAQRSGKSFNQEEVGDSRPPPQNADKQAEQVSSAVENAKKVLGIDSVEVSNSPLVSIASGQSNRQLLNKIKEFSDKLHHGHAGVDNRDPTEKEHSPAVKGDKFDRALKVSQISAADELGMMKSLVDKISTVVSTTRRSLSASPAVETKSEQTKKVDAYEQTKKMDTDEQTKKAYADEQTKKVDASKPGLKGSSPILGNVNQNQPVVASKSHTPTKKLAVDAKPQAKELPKRVEERIKDLPERAEEYVKDHLVEGNDLHEVKGTSKSPLNNVYSVVKEAVLRDEPGDSPSQMVSPSVDEHDGDKRDSKDAASSDGRGAGDEKDAVSDVTASEAGDDDKDVPPVGSKLDQEVVSAIKVRAHSLAANTTGHPSSPLLDSHNNNLFTDNGEKTQTKFPNPRHFFMNVSSKSFTLGSKEGKVRPSGSIASRTNTSSGHNLKKVIIFPKKKGFQTDNGINLKAAEVLQGDDVVGRAVAAAAEVVDGTPEVPMLAEEEPNDVEQTLEEPTLEDEEKSLGETPPSEEIKEKKKKEDKREEALEKEIEAKVEEKISPTTVISEGKKKKDKTDSGKPSGDEEVVDTEKQKKSKDGKKEDTLEDVKDKDDAQKVVSEEKEKEADGTKEKLEVDTLSDVESKRESKSEKEKEETAEPSQEEKTEEVVKEGKDEEDIKVKEEEAKDPVAKTDKDKTEDEEKPVKIEKEGPSDTEEPGKTKKPSDSKKDKKKKAEGGEEETSSDKAKAETVEGTKTGDEKSEDTLETYSQFTQRVSAEKKNDAANGHGTNGHSKGSKVKGKNYASPDCGAKLVTANPEASHSSKVIHPNKDEYMLNKCRDKIWFVIELCESIRPQKFDIANFELFSNLPKDIQVLGSHRYPSRDWTSFGWFKGQEGNRGLQSFRTDTEDFFKYIKVEVTSNYGSEFYCPISTFQIYGLSEFEVIDTIEDQAEDTDDDSEPDIEAVEETTKKKSKEEGKQGVIPTVLKNMFSGVLDVIKRGYRPSSSASEAGENCYSIHPKFAVENEICPMARSLNYILSCYNMEYEALMQQPFVSSTVKNSSFCRQLALTMCAEPEVNDSIVYDTTCNNSYVCVMLSPKHVLAMCFMQDPQIMDKGISCESGGGTLSENFSATPDLTPSIEPPAYVKNADINTSSITRSDAIEANLSDSVELLSKKSGPEVIKDGKISAESSPDKKEPVDVPIPESLVAEPSKPSPKELKQNGNVAKEKVAKEGEHEAPVGAAEPEEKVEVEGSGVGGIDLGEEEIPPAASEETSTIHPPPPPPPPPSSSPPPSSPSQPAEPKVSNSPTNKESVVVRLSNKIKALEYNMSISSQYLEELSRRYKRQMEEMQRQFNLTIAALNNTSTQAYERDQHHQRDIEKLEEQLANVSNILQKLVDERETLAHTVVEQHVLLMVVEVIVLCMVFTVCFRRRSSYRHNTDYGQTRRNQTPSDDSSGSVVDQDTNYPNADSQGRVRVRRRSVDSITSERNSRLRQRRPSEEALNISGTYQDLLIIEPAIPILMDSVSDRKKKRKSNSGTLKRSKSNASIVDKSYSSRRAKRLEKLNVSSAGVLFCGDEVDSKTAVPPPDDSPVYAPNPEDVYGLMHHPISNDDGSVFYDYTENLSSLHDRCRIGELGISEGFPTGGQCVSKRHSLACINCDNEQRKGEKLSKTYSLDSGPEKSKSGQEKVKKIKRLKKAKVKDSASLFADTSQTQIPLPSYNKDYYYPKPNGISYCSPIETYDSYYYNGHTSVHFSEDTKEHCDHTFSHSEEVSVNGGYSNGIDMSGTDHYRHLNEFSRTNHDTPSASEKKKSSPRVKSKVKLRSDNWEWYSSQHAGSSSETVSTCSDSSGKNRKVKKEEAVDHQKCEEKKGKRKKKSKSKSSVLLEEETVLEAEAGT